jgi:hypothetical protein
MKSLQDHVDALREHMATCQECQRGIAPVLRRGGQVVQTYSAWARDVRYRCPLARQMEESCARDT